MPQIFQVLRCFKCSVFQVHQTKKSCKWQCKLCDEKQSIKRHYGIGTGKECRMHVQKLNKMRGDKEEFNQNVMEYNIDTNSEDEIFEDEMVSQKPLIKEITENSKWNAYVDNGEELIQPNTSNIENVYTYKQINHENITSKYSKKPNKFYMPLKKSICDAKKSLLNKNLFDSKENEESTKKMCIKNFTNNYNLQSKCIKEMGNDDFTNLSNKIDQPNTNVASTKKPNSKWLNYIDDHDELDSSNQPICSREDLAKGSKVEDNNMQIKVISNMKEDMYLQNLKENIINKIESLGQFDTAKSNNNNLPKNSNRNDELENSLANIFTLCHDNDLDSILKI